MVCPLNGEGNDFGIPIRNRESKNQDGPLLLHSEKAKCSFSQNHRKKGALWSSSPTPRQTLPAFNVESKVLDA